jgi:PBSX family phage terminase large subunit
MFEFFNICPAEFIAEHSKTEHKVTFFNGSTLIFRHLEEPDKLKSLNLGFFAIDEMTEIPEDVFLMLQSRLRRNNVPRRVGFGSTNPEGHDWVWHKWCVAHKDDPNYLFVRAPTYENKYLPSDYVSDLEASYPDHWRKRYIEGDPTAFAGQILTTWDDRIHVVEPFDVPKDWNRAVILDHGTNNPTAVIWMAIHPENFKIVYREHYEAQQVIEHHFKKIVEYTGSDDVGTYIADPAIFNKTLQDPRRGIHSVADEYAELGLHFIQGDNDVKSGLQKLVEHFNIWPQLKNPFTQQQGSPKIFITRDCENTIYEVPQYRWKDVKIRGRYRSKPEEPEKANDHTVDCIRYGLMSNLQPSKQKTRGFKPFPGMEDRVWSRIEKTNKEHKRRHAGVVGGF